MDMQRRLAFVFAGLLLLGASAFACEEQSVHLQAAAMTQRIAKRTPMMLQGHAVRIEGTIELMVIVEEDGKPSCISVVRGHPILTSTAIASVKCASTGCIRATEMFWVSSPSNAV